jgi:hypothetical protein
MHMFVMVVLLRAVALLSTMMAWCSAPLLAK